MTVQKFRHEIKHFINISDYYVLKSRLSAVTKPDPHTGIDGSYKIRSLYFDNLQDKALREKIDGLDRREKFRIRYYDDDFSYVKLEKKSKIRGLCEKKTAPISKAQCEALKHHRTVGRFHSFHQRGAGGCPGFFDRCSGIQITDMGTQGPDRRANAGK